MFRHKMITQTYKPLHTQGQRRGRGRISGRPSGLFKLTVDVTALNIANMRYDRLMGSRWLTINVLKANSFAFPSSFFGPLDQIC